MREWNPYWRDLADANHAPTMRRMVLASINWIEHNPGAYPEWREKQPPAHKAAIRATHWADILDATNEDARRWFEAIAAEAGGRPLCSLMTEAVAAGVLVARYGWEAFNEFMLTTTPA